MAKLNSNVWFGGNLYRTGTTPPPAVAARITNPKVWDGDPPAATPVTDDPPEGGGPGGGTVQEPPRRGAGSGADAWRTFLTAQGATDLPADANRDDLVALWDARKLQG